MVSYTEHLHLQHWCFSIRVLSLVHVLNTDMYLLKYIHDYFQHPTWQYLLPAYLKSSDTQICIYSSTFMIIFSIQHGSIYGLHV